MSFVLTSEDQAPKKSEYKKNGKPPSREALYRARVRCGAYCAGGDTSVLGISPSKGSEAAAVNATRVIKDPKASQAQEPNWEASMAASRAKSLLTSDISLETVVDSRFEPISSQNCHLKDLDLSKVLVSAKWAAEKRLDERIHPTKPNFANGLITNSNSLRSDTTSQFGSACVKGDAALESESEIDAAHYAIHAVSAASAIKEQPGNKYNRGTIQLQVLDNAYYRNICPQKIFALAQERVHRRLSTIDKDIDQKMLFNNEEYNKAAVKVAKRHHEERQQLNGGKVNLGGGLWLRFEEIERIARMFVTSILDDVGNKKNKQRAIGTHNKQKDLTYDQEYAEIGPFPDQNFANYQCSENDTSEIHRKDFQYTEATHQESYDALVEEKEDLVRSKLAEVERVEAEYENLKNEAERRILDEEVAAQRKLLEQENNYEAELECIQETKEELNKTISKMEDNLNRQQDLMQAFTDAQESSTKVIHDIELQKTKKMELQHELNDISFKLKDQERELHDLKTTEEDIKLEIDGLTNLAAENIQKAEHINGKVDSKQKDLNRLVEQKKAELENTQSTLSSKRAVLMDIMNRNEKLKTDHFTDMKRYEDSFKIDGSSRTSNNPSSLKSDATKYSSFDHDNIKNRTNAKVKKVKQVQKENLNMLGSAQKKSRISSIRTGLKSNMPLSLSKLFKKIIHKKQDYPRSLKSGYLKDEEFINNSTIRTVQPYFSETETHNQSKPSQGFTGMDSIEYKSPLTTTERGIKEEEIDEIHGILCDGSRGFRNRKKSLFTEVF